MELSLLVLAGLLGAVLAPSLYRVSPRLGRLAAIVVPGGLTVRLLGLAGGAAAGLPPAVSVPWVPSLGIRFALRLDGLSLLFSLLIAGIGTAVVVYAGGYLPESPRQGRFYAYILAFMASMLGVVLADDPFLLFVFWELTSITSFLLIGFDHEREAARQAALQALLTTGFGGLALLAGLVVLQSITGPATIAELAGQAEAIRTHPWYPAALVLVLVGAFAKLAQFPFHFWLPNAMEAPTPVSAYLHSATMVKAGVYLLARLLPALGGTPLWQGLVTGGGAVTLVVGAVLTIRHTDLKAVLAYATVSALGALVMLAGIGTEAATVALAVYVLGHAFYKSGLFLVAGVVDHETGTRDLARLGGLARPLPLVAVAGALAALSMAGVPPLLGFLSKEALYQAAWDVPQWAPAVTAAVVVAHVLLFTVAMRTGLTPFLGRRQETPREPHGASPALWLPPVVLAMLGALLMLALEVVDQGLVSPAASALLGQQVRAGLGLWHGLTPVLGLSALTIALGLGLLALWPRVVRAVEPIQAVSAIGPARWYDAALSVTNAVARIQTDVLQSGYLRRYVLIVLSTTAALVGFTMLTRGWQLGPLLPEDVRFYEVAVVLVMLAAALGAVLARSRLAAVAFLGVVGYGVSLIYVWFGAPDLAMTQFMVETLVVILFVTILYRLPPFPVLSARRTRIRDAAVAVAAGGTMGALALIASGVSLPTRVSDFHVLYSYSLAHGRNMVNVILVDFRALDTLGETTVLATAALGVLSLLRLTLARGGKR
ncbi:MAG: putative monovalent cation/H+ antiporter subunit A [Anaerolineae bacterium]|nr:putative monovalent cation/H+ antiporter subunit A [Anaerolineae bacterium]